MRCCAACVAARGFGGDQTAGSLVALQQLDREPARIGTAGADRRGGDWLQRCNLALDLVGKLNRRLWRPRFAGGAGDLRLQLLHPFATTGDHRHHLAAEAACKPFNIDLQASGAGNIDHVEGDDNRHPHLDDLRGQVKVSLQI